VRTFSEAFLLGALRGLVLREDKEGADWTLTRPPPNKPGPAVMRLHSASAGEEGGRPTLRAEYVLPAEGAAAESGIAELVMAGDGRSFEGTLCGPGGEARLWRGARLGVGTGMRRKRRGAKPPQKAAWVHDSYTRRGRLLLAAGDAAAARADALAAVRLCPRAADGWSLLADAAESEGEAAAAAAEVEWLQGWA